MNYYGDMSEVMESHMLVVMITLGTCMDKLIGYDCGDEVEAILNHSSYPPGYTYHSFQSNVSNYSIIYTSYSMFMDDHFTFSVFGQPHFNGVNRVCVVFTFPRL